MESLEKTASAPEQRLTKKEILNGIAEMAWEFGKPIAGLAIPTYLGYLFGDSLKGNLHSPYLFATLGFVISAEMIAAHYEDLEEQRWLRENPGKELPGGLMDL